MQGLVVAIGAVITVASAMVAGLRIERFAARYVAWLPQGVGPVGGLVVGIAVVATWLMD